MTVFYAVRVIAGDFKRFWDFQLETASSIFESSHSFRRYYEQDLALAKDLQDKLAQAKAYCNLGLAHKALGEYSKAEECQRYLLSLAQTLDNTQVELSTWQVSVILSQTRWDG